jgi:hypothetical protein
MGLRQIPQESISLLHPSRVDNLDGSWLFGNSFEALVQQLAGLGKPVIHCENKAIECVWQDCAYFHSKMIDFFDENNNINTSVWVTVSRTPAHYKLTCRWKVLRTVDSLR